MRIATVLMLLVVAACGDAGAELSGTTTTVLSPDTGAETSTTVTVPDPVPPTTTTLATTTTDTGGSDSRDVPSEPRHMEAKLSDEILEEIIRHAAERTGVDPGSVEVVSITEEMFNDSSLGCPKPGEFYTQVITPGYIVIVHAGGAEFDYRVGPSSWKLCDK